MSSALLPTVPWFHRALRTPAVLVLIGLGTTGLGYRAGLDHTGTPSTLRLNDFPDASEFSRCDTFSEIGMLRARLRGLSHRALHELNVATLRKRQLAKDPADPSPEVLDALSNLVAELRHTPEEEPALRILLFRLARINAHERWLALYLDFTRRNPTASLAADLQAEAESIARTCGRESELLQRRTLLDRWIEAPQWPGVTP